MPLLEDLLSYIIIADSVSTGFNQVKLKANFLSTFGTKITSEREQTLTLDIIPLHKKEAIGELYYLISEVVNRIVTEGCSASYGVQIMEIVLNALANVSEIDDESSNTLHETINLLLDTYDFKASDEGKTKRKNSKAEETKENQDIFLENLKNNLDDLGFKSEIKYLVTLFNNKDCITISLNVDIKKAEKNLEKSEKVYLSDQKTMAQRICLQKRLRKLYLKKKKDFKLKERLIFNPSKTNYPLELINAALSLNNTNLNGLQRLLVSLSLKVDMFESINTKYRSLLLDYAVNTVDNPIDFHYISSLLTKIVDYSLEYVNIIKESLKNRETLKKNDVKEMLKEKMKNIEDIMNEYYSWREMKQSKPDEKVAKKQKLSRAKWEEEALVLKMQEIAKKRKGLKKQSLQQMQKLRQKIFGKK